MWSLNPIHLRVKMTKMLRQSWYPGNFFPRTKTMPALLNNQRRSAVLQCLCFATGTRKWLRFVRMFKALLSFTTINLRATEIFFYGHSFQLDDSKRRRSTKRSQYSGEFLAPVLYSWLFNIKCFWEALAWKTTHVWHSQWSSSSWIIQDHHCREGERDAQGQYSKHPAPYTHSHFPNLWEMAPRWVDLNSHLRDTLHLVM